MNKLPLNIILDIERKPAKNKMLIIIFLLGLVIGFGIGMACFKNRVVSSGLSLDLSLPPISVNPLN